MFSIVSSYKEQFLHVCRSRLSVCIPYTIERITVTRVLFIKGCLSFFKLLWQRLSFFLVNLLASAIKLCGILYVAIRNEEKGFHSLSQSTYIKFAAFDCPPANTNFARFAGVIRRFRISSP